LNCDGAAGSDVALETADVVLMADRLGKLVGAIRLGRRSQVIVKQNIAFALSTIVLLLIANFAGNITMPLGVIGHEGSTVIVTLRPAVAEKLERADCRNSLHQLHNVSANGLKLFGFRCATQLQIPALGNVISAPGP